MLRTRDAAKGLHKNRQMVAPANKVQRPPLYRQRPLNATINRGFTGVLKGGHKK